MAATHVAGVAGRMDDGQDFSSPISNGPRPKVSGQPDTFEQEEEVDYEDDDGDYGPDSGEETEQPHSLASAPMANGTKGYGPQIRVGKGGTRAQPASVPARGASLMGPDAGDQQVQHPYSEGARSRRMAGGLSGSRTALAEAPPMARANSHVSATSSSNRSFYRPAAGAKSNLSDWAPKADPVMQETAIDNLPNWNDIKPGDPTSKPITRVEKEMDWSFRRLISENVFKQLLDDPLGRHRFRTFLDSEEETGAEMLDFYFDLNQYERQAQHLKETTEALHDLYLAEDSESHVNLKEQDSDELYTTLRRTFDMQVSLNPMQENIRQSLYKNQFQRFIRSMIVEQYRVKLGAFAEEDEDYTGLGDCFCLTNPRAGSENPIVLVSPGFVEVTGYPARAIIGRNCRFLQSAGTNPDAIQRIRDALNTGTPITELLLNYKRDGTPFFNLLSIIPLRDATGRIVYFLGGQTNVTGTLASSKGLGFLVGSDSSAPQPEPQMYNGYEYSPTMARHLAASREMSGSNGGGNLAGQRMVKSASSHSGGRTRRPAAGAVDPARSSEASDQTLTSQKGSQGFMSKIFGGRSGGARRGSGAQISHNSGPPGTRSTQVLLGAEGVMRSAAPARLAEQIELFTDLYSRLIIFKRTKREIIFVTPPVIELLGLPSGSASDIHNSSLLHADVLSLILGSSKDETRTLRNAVGDAIRQGRNISVMTGLRKPAKTGLMGQLLNTSSREAQDYDGTVFRALHITPLHDRDGASFAFVAVLG